ncbi:VOC family protein [Paenibacillus sp. PR3]|uniref:VOC family protein n=1 Tax=Paenibacillus terricola TaxID=2763503 RepID=A0ABR8MSR9_9BACL|nr:VOC family protein [Paenibacillus terricola]MBD3919028.1 VOC family protein [Paenibacillus terricola]
MAETMLNSVSFLQVPVKHLEESMDWYINKLGFELHFKRPDNKMAIVALPSGPSIFLCEKELHQGTMSVVIGFEATDIVRLLSDLQSNGVQIGEVRKERGAIRTESGKTEILGMDFDFYDPSGNMLVAHGKTNFVE